MVRLRTGVVRFFVIEPSMTRPEKDYTALCQRCDCISSSGLVECRPRSQRRLVYISQKSRESENTQIAAILDNNKTLAYQVLVQKTKSMRRQVRKEHNRS